MAPDTAAARPAPTSACQFPPGWSAVAARHSRYVIFGEVHGTREAPAFVGDLVCALARKGERVLLGIELAASDNRALQRAWSLPPSRFPAALRRTGFAGREDGVASQAMFDLLRRLHALHATGQAVDVVAFNGAVDEAQRQKFAHLPGQGGHEAAQAENIRRAADARPYDRVLVLVGNFHARKTLATDSLAGAFRPMAMNLGSPTDVTSLNLRSAGGSMWNCTIADGVKFAVGQPIPANAVHCGNQISTTQKPLFSTNQRFIRLGPAPDETDDQAYDGLVWLGPIHGSRPAVPAAPRR